MPISLEHNSFGTVGKSQKQNQQTQMTDIDLRSLIELGCVKEPVTIDNVTFVLRSLSAEERSIAGRLAKDAADPAVLFELNTLILAMSIETVNGKPLEQLYEGPEVSAIDAKKLIIKNMQDSVLGKLLEAYTEVSKRADAKFSGEQIKK